MEGSPGNWLKKQSRFFILLMKFGGFDYFQLRLVQREMNCIWAPLGFLIYSPYLVLVIYDFHEFCCSGL